MSDTIILSENRETSLPIRFFIPSSICQHAKLSPADAANIGAKFSASASLYINRYSHTKDGRTEMLYDVFSACGVFTCVKSMEYGNYRAISFSTEDFNPKRKAINKGISFAFKRKILVSIQYGTDFWNYEGGKTVDYLSARDCSDVIHFIDNEFDKRDGEAKEPTEISQELSSLLNRAETYSETDYILEENAALIDGRLFYEQVSASENSKGDIKKYRFHCVLSENQQGKRITEKWTVNKVVQITLTDNTNVSVPICQIEFKNEQPVLELTFTQQVDFDTIPSSGFIQIPLCNTIRKTQLKAFNQIRENNIAAQFLDEVIATKTCKPHKTENMQPLIRSFEKREYPLNESQRMAIEKALSAQDLILVMGPPGTGKTTVIAEWVKYLVGEKKARVLIASQNNSAVDNVLKKIKDEPGVDVLRISSDQQKVDDDVLDTFYSNKVNQTREAISEKVTENQQELTELQAQWNEIVAAFDVIAPIYDAYRHTKQKIQKNVESAAELYKKIRTLFADITKLATRFYEKYSSLTIVDKIYSAYDRYVPIRKIFFGVGILLRIILKHKAKRLEEKHTAIQAKIDAYNSSIEAYNALIRQMQAELCQQIHASTEAFRERIDKLDIHAVVNDAYGIFSIKKEWIDNIADIEYFGSIFGAISAGGEKLRAAQKVLTKWNEHISNTQNYAIESILLQSANVVGATCVGISSNPYVGNLDFDVVIIDEAGQIQIHNCLIPMRLGKKVIMLGDHKQLPPVAKQEALQILEEQGVDKTLYAQSLFEYLYNILPESNKTMLNTQYRMPKVIADILSVAFYEKKYKTHESKERVSSGIGMFDNKPFVVIDTSDSARRWEEKGTHINKYEAEICERIFTKLADSTGSPDKVAILAGLRNQKEYIQEKIAEKHGQDVARRVVHTVDGYQGRECDTVIFSFTRSSKRLEDEVRIGFLSELRRLNVAMSRCKRCLVLVGDMEFLTQCKNTTGYQGAAEKGLIGTEESFSQFLEDVLCAANSPDAIRMDSKQLNERLDET